MLDRRLLPHEQLGAAFDVQRFLVTERSGRVSSGSRVHRFTGSRVRGLRRDLAKFAGSRRVHGFAGSVLLSRVWLPPSSRAWRSSPLRVTALGASLGASDAPNTLTAAEKAAGWRLLFDGSSTSGWRGYNKPDMSGLRWVVKDGAVCLPPADGADTRGQSRHHHADTFGDFDLTWQWQVQPGSNSGLKYFVVESGDCRHRSRVPDSSTMPGTPMPRSAPSGRRRPSTT